MPGLEIQQGARLSKIPAYEVDIKKTSHKKRKERNQTPVMVAQAVEAKLGQTMGKLEKVGL